MKTKLSRREFLKLTGLASLGIVTPQFLTQPGTAPAVPGGKNVLVIVFDAFSAYHLALNGYARETMPNLKRLAEKAVVYHNHFSGGNYTTPGTASLLTGTQPWSHRAFEGGSRVAENVARRNIFEAFEGYYRMAYSHNRYAITFLEQFLSSTDNLIPYENLILEGKDLVSKLFHKDEDIASVAWIRALKPAEGPTYSLFLSRADSISQASQERKMAAIRKDFPRGLPYTKQDNHFLLEQAIDYVAAEIGKAPQPFLGYFHFLPPHRPYNTRREFFEAFDKDGYVLPKKPEHIFSGGTSYELLAKWCNWYDEYLLYVDAEFARLYDQLEQAGILANTWLVLTSDHGELFEHGVVGHSTPLLNQPVIRVPLVIFEPGRSTRLDIDAPTSAIDVLPTLLHLTSQPIPDWAEGTLLPPYAPNGQPQRDLFVIDSRNSRQAAPITEASITVIRDGYKLIWYTGYKELKNSGDLIELYDLNNDPQELNDFSGTQTALAEELLNAIKTRLKEVNQPFQ
jgi:arylsulfatase A-like enzyme